MGDITGIRAPRRIGPGINGPRSHKQGSNVLLRRVFMVLFDPRSNARLACRPADLPSSYNSRGGGVVTPAIPTTLKLSRLKAMYAPCIPLSTCLPSLLARHARVLSLLLYLPHSGPKLVLRQSHLLTKYRSFISPPSIKKPSYSTKHGTVALNASSSRTLHSSSHMR